MPQILESLRGDLAPLERRLFENPYVAAVERGELARDDLRVFAGQQQRIIGSDLRSVALLVHRYGGTSSGAFFAAALETETTALQHLATLTRALGFDLVEIGRRCGPYPRCPVEIREAYRAIDTASARSSAAPSPRHALPCMQPSVRGWVAANRSMRAGAFFEWEK